MFTKRVEEILDWQERRESTSNGLVGVVDQDLKVTYLFLGLPMYTKHVISSNIGNYKVDTEEVKKVGF